MIENLSKNKFGLSNKNKNINKYISQLMGDYPNLTLCLRFEF